MVLTTRPDLRCALPVATPTFSSISRASAGRPLHFPTRRFLSPLPSTTSFRLTALSTDAKHASALEPSEKPPVCTADELHYVPVSDSNWRLALWRYHPSPQAPPRSHPLLLLSGVGTNAIGYDLSPESSFARYMSSQGFDTWILEVRGAGLSEDGTNSKATKQSSNALSKTEAGKVSSAGKKSNTPSPWEESDVSAVSTVGVSSAENQSSSIPKALSEADVSEKLTETFMRLSERSSGFPIEDQSEGISTKLFDQLSKLLEDSPLYEPFNEIRATVLSLLESRQNSGIAGQIRDLSQRLVNILDEAQRSIPSPLFDWQERLTSIIEDIQIQLDLIVKYDWDFDHYLEEDVPAAMEYIRAQCNPKDGKLMAIGHSMGGILLYSMLSRCGYEGKDPKLAAVVTLAASLDYTSSKSALKLLLPLANPAQALNVPAVPLGTLLSVAHPLSLPWIISLISAEDMMHPELLEKLMLNNFCTIPAKLLLQLRTAFQEGGLRDRNGTFFYKNYLRKSRVPVLAFAGDQDLICPPEAVEATVKLIPKRLVTYEVLGEPGGAHFAHYDLVGGRLAVEKVYPRIIQFLSQHDSE